MSKLPAVLIHAARRRQDGIAAGARAAAIIASG
jgi:hypothetical protein